MILRNLLLLVVFDGLVTGQEWLLELQIVKPISFIGVGTKSLRNYGQDTYTIKIEPLGYLTGIEHSDWVSKQSFRRSPYWLRAPSILHQFWNLSQNTVMSLFSIKFHLLYRRWMTYVFVLLWWLLTGQFSTIARSIMNLTALSGMSFSSSFIDYKL